MRALTAFLLVLQILGGQVTTGPKLNIVVVEGDSAINNIRQRTAREPIVQVEDENRKPVAGAVVVFMLPSQGASGTFADGARSLTIVTDESGRAVGRGLRPNNASGQMQIRVTASFQGQTASATISQTNLATAGAAASGVSAKLIAVIVAAGAAVAGGVVAGTRGSGSGTGPGPASAVPPTTITAGAGTVGPPP